LLTYAKSEKPTLWLYYLHMWLNSSQPRNCNRLKKWSAYCFIFKNIWVIWMLLILCSFHWFRVDVAIHIQNWLSRRWYKNSQKRNKKRMYIDIIVRYTKKNFWLDIRYARKAVPGVSYDSLKGSIILIFPENGLCKKNVNIVRLTLDPFFFTFDKYKMICLLKF
jgi:hypothetical protein